MKQSRTKIAQVVAAKTLENGVSQRYSEQIAAYLLSERRVDELSSLMRDVQSDWAAAGHVEVIASSAHALSADSKTMIMEQIKGMYPNASHIIVTEAYDPAIIGGVRLSLANQQLDLSIEAKLHKFKQLITAAKE